MPVQSVLFEKRWWTPVKAEAWLRKNRFLAPPDTRADETEHELRYRQAEPSMGSRYMTKPLVNYKGIKLVIDLGPGPKWARGAAGAREPEPDYDVFTVNRETSDEELDEWGRANIADFLGVVARSNLCELYPEDRTMPPGSSCIINLDYGPGPDGDGYQRGGTHWTAVRVSSEAPQVLYVDPFGAPPPRDVTLRAALDSRTVLYPDIINQGMDEVNCGPRALAVLHQLAEAAKEGKELEAFAGICQV